MYAAPGNAGTALIAQNLDIEATDIETLVKAAQTNNIDLTVVGPEAPLADGIVDQFLVRGLQVFGPTQAAAQIECSKVFAKDLMQKYGIPCAQSDVFSDYEKAQKYVQQKGVPLVIKADGLAGGKGVIVAETVQEAMEALSNIMKAKAFGSAGDRVIIEEKLTGKEVSYFAFSDGTSTVPMVPACDYKRVYNGDQGPNTGGMGSFSPPYWFTPDIAEKVEKAIMKPTVKALAQEGRKYSGVLYAGLMVNNKEPKVLEFNARFGDPECQVTLPRLKTDIVDIMLAVIDGKLNTVQAEWSDQACVGVVLASGGYPGNYQTGFPITGLDALDTDVIVFHAGTKQGSRPGEFLTGGGRVLTVVAMGNTTEDARQKIYANIPRIHFQGCHYRKDIAAIRR